MVELEKACGNAKANTEAYIRKLVEVEDNAKHDLGAMVE